MTGNYTPAFFIKNHDAFLRPDPESSFFVLYDGARQLFIPLSIAFFQRINVAFFIDRRGRGGRLRLTLRTGVRPQRQAGVVNIEGLKLKGAATHRKSKHKR